MKISHQTIAPGEDFPAALIEELLGEARIKRTDGRIVLNLKQGGVRSVETEAFREIERK